MLVQAQIWDIFTQDAEKNVFVWLKLLPLG